MPEVNPFLLATVIIISILAIILIIIVLANRQSAITTSSTSAAPTCSIAPNIPTNVVVTNPQGDILAVTWNLLASVDTYTAYVGITPGFPKASAVASRTVTKNSASFGNLAVGVQYYIKVLATNACGSSALSAETTFTIPFNYPSRFVIADQTNPVFICCWSDNIISPTFQETSSRFCNSNTSQVFHQNSDNTIRLSSNTSKCLTRTGGQIWMNQCIVDSSQTWFYSSLDSTLCSPSAPTTQCLVETPTSSGFNALSYGPKGAPESTSWNLVAV